MSSVGGQVPSETAEAVAAAHRAHWARVVAATARSCRDLGLAEESTQAAFEQALLRWAEAGTPRDPLAWLTTTAHRRAVDTIRRRGTERRLLPDLLWPAEPAPTPPHVADEDAAVVRDETLRLVFLCAHPALAPEASVALTLRLVCGLSTADIAAAFLVSEPTMAARLTRAKKKIALSRIPCRVPTTLDLPDRVMDVLDVISVMLTTGHRAPSGTSAHRVELLGAATDLLRTLRRLVPTSGEVAGLLAQALMLNARDATRADAHGRPIPLAEQDRSRWDQALLDEADQLIAQAMAAGRRGGYLLHAAIVSLECRAPTIDDVDWVEVVALYDHLIATWTSPIVALNRAVAISHVAGAEAALTLVEPLAPELDGYRYFHAARADLLSRAGRTDEALAAYREALRVSGNDAETWVLDQRVRSAQGAGG